MEEGGLGGRGRSPLPPSTRKNYAGLRFLSCRFVFVVVVVVVVVVVDPFLLLLLWGGGAPAKKNAKNTVL